MEAVGILLQVHVRDRLEHAQCDAVLDSEAVAVDIGDGRERVGHELAITLAADRSRIAQAILVASVAEHRGVDGLALKEALPEAGRDVVDGGASGRHRSLRS